jgi:hypothetical protein
VLREAEQISTFGKVQWPTLLSTTIVLPGVPRERSCLEQAKAFARAERDKDSPAAARC